MLLYLAIYVIVFIAFLLTMAILVGGEKLTINEAKNIRTTLFAIPLMVTLIVWAVRIIIL